MLINPSVYAFGSRFLSLFPLLVGMFPKNIIFGTKIHKNGFLLLIMFMGVHPIKCREKNEKSTWKSYVKNRWRFEGEVYSTPIFI